MLSESGPPLELTVAVSNVGGADGFETVQLYVRDEKSRLPRPEKELVSFEKVFLERDQTRHLRIRIDKYAVGYYDTSLRAWIAEEGRFEVLIGASSADIRLVLIALAVMKFPGIAALADISFLYRRKISFEVKESFTWVF